MVAIIAVPPLLVGPPIYDSDQIVRAGIAALIAGITGVAVQNWSPPREAWPLRPGPILDTAQDAFVAVDDEGMVIEDWNPQAERTFGWTARGDGGRRSIWTRWSIPTTASGPVKRLHRFPETGT